MMLVRRPAPGTGAMPRLPGLDSNASVRRVFESKAAGQPWSKQPIPTHWAQGG
jgi:hypothetical protein